MMQRLWRKASPLQKGKSAPGRVRLWSDDRDQLRRRDVVADRQGGWLVEVEVGNQLVGAGVEDEATAHCWRVPLEVTRPVSRRRQSATGSSRHSNRRHSLVATLRPTRAQRPKPRLRLKSDSAASMAPA